MEPPAKPATHIHSLTETVETDLAVRLEAGDHDALAELFSLFNDKFQRLIG